MFNITKKSIQWGDDTLELETGKIARQADGAVVARYGGTTVLCTATAAKNSKEGIDFFPLTVQYQEKAYAAGKIPGGYFKREGRPTERETLISRLIDRPIRPLFPSAFRNETQVIITVLAHDLVNDPDIPAMVGASAALAISGIPFNGPIGAARVAYIDGNYVLNPAIGFEDESELDLVVAGTKSSLMMVESEAVELPEDVMLGALKFAHESMQPAIQLIEDFAKECGKPRWEVAEEDYSELYNKIKTKAEQPLRDAYAIREKQARTEAVNNAKSAAIEALEAEFAEDEALDSTVTGSLLKKLEKDIVRTDILKKGVRIDGRKADEIRQIESETGILPSAHGSALFTRGETQALVVATLGTGQDEQRIDSLEGDSFERFMLHYNFPPFSVGEVGMLRGPGRREIGHGKLAWRALHSLIPTKEEFPYTLRLVSEITESNGSSSMATVCGCSLALMDAGVPLKRSVSGIAMGLILEGTDYAVLSDIMGDEDHLGDMDFKVAGTREGVTSLQMDIKIEGITLEIMKTALEQANAGRLHILDRMADAIDEPRQELNASAPKIVTLKIPVDKIREVIGTGGKVIREICETSGAKVDIEDDGTIRISSPDDESLKKAKDMIDSIVVEPEVGTIYEDCEVVKIVDFGAFVQFFGKLQGLVHISELVPQRVEKVTDIINEGDRIKVKLLEIDRSGKFRLSMKSVNQETGEDIEDQVRQKKAG